jgi:hypothetical protein
VSIERLMTERITIVRGSTVDVVDETDVDDYGVPETAVGSPTTVGIVNAWVTQTSGLEADDNRQTTFAEWMIYLPAGTDLRAADVIVREDGTTRIEVIEPPHLARRAITGEVHHVEARGRTVTG